MQRLDEDLAKKTDEQSFHIQTINENNLEEYSTKIGDDHQNKELEKIFYHLSSHEQPSSYIDSQYDEIEDGEFPPNMSINDIIDLGDCSLKSED